MFDANLCLISAVFKNRLNYCNVLKSADYTVTKEILSCIKTTVVDI